MTDETAPKILVSCINFAPDHAGIGVYSTDWSVFLVEQGHDVSVVTGFPYYPRWQKRPQDSGRLYARESYLGVRVVRGYLYVPAVVSTVRRLWHELTFCIFALLNFVRAGRPDVIVLFLPPFFLGMVGVLMKWIWRRPLVINVQDLPLDAAFSLGMVKRGKFSAALYALEGWIYRRADLVATISPKMIASLKSRGIPPDRLTLVPNWIDVAPAMASPPSGNFLAEHPEAAGKFTVAYAGNLGIKQGVDTLLHLAKEMDNDPDFHFFVIGDGADRERLHRLAAELNCKNVTFLPFLDPDAYRSMLADVDMVFVAQRSGAGDNFFPSKLLGLTAASKPLLVAADEDSELSKMVRESGCGLVSRYNDVETMVGHLKLAKASPDLLGKLGDRGVDQVQQYDRAEVLGRWQEQIEALIELRVGRKKATGRTPSARQPDSDSATSRTS